MLSLGFTGTQTIPHGERGYVEACLQDLVDRFLPPEFGQGYPPIPVSDFYSLGKIGIELAGGDAKKGNCPDDMNPLLRDFLVNLTRRDPMKRARWDGMADEDMTTADDLRDRINELRIKAWGRDECEDIFKLRSTA